MSTVIRPKGDSGYSQSLPCSFESAGAARRLVRSALAVWNLDDLAEDAELVVTELVANASRHTSSRLIRIALSQLDEETVLITVVDRNKEPVVRRPARPGDTDGRGLMLVDALTQHWGVTALPWGKRVWATLAHTVAP